MLFELAKRPIFFKSRLMALVSIMVWSTLTAFTVPENVKEREEKLFSLLAGYKLKTVVIDPGHGGKDPGALGTGRYKDTEADVVLSIGLKLREYIQQNYPDVKVVMTRTTDVFIPLRERTEIANKANADLFISLHCNSASAAAYGAETYVLGMHKTEAQMNVAKRENQVIYLEDDYKEHYSNFDPTSPESMIALSLMQNAFLDKSIAFADMIQYQFRERVKRHDRGVRQAGFWVISRTVMPAVLIELGFVSNSAEEDYLNSDLGRTYIASGIYRAFKEYKISLEGYDSSQKNRPSTTDKSSSENTDREEQNDEVLEEMPTNENLIFKVQLMASGTKRALKPENFKGLKDVEEMEDDGLYKYTVGNTTNFEKAIKLQREVRETAYKDAYIIALYNGKKISLPEALKILKNNN
tara:strand:+ start:2480 stop:3712 length:1233 start_codon:yes stop_codon:yes gene_type:complete